MHHEPVRDTPPGPITPSSSTRPPRPKWSHTRLKIHNSRTPKTSTPLRFHSPFTTPTHTPPSFDTSLLKRRLFTPTSTPRKKRPTDQPHTSPLIRIAGGQERTQPVTVASSSSRRVKGGNGCLMSVLKKADRTAELNMRVLKTLLAGDVLDVEELRRLMGKGLVVSVVSTETGIFVVTAVQGEGDEFVVVVPREFDVENGSVDGLVLFVPEPWSPIRVSESAPSPSGLYIVPHRIAVLEGKEVEIVMENCKLNEGLQPWLRSGSGNGFGSQYEVPETQDPEAEGVKYDNGKQGFDGLSVVKTLACVSPHMRRWSLQVTVDVHFKNFDIAVVRDETGEPAIYICPEHEVLQKDAICQLTDVRLCPQRIVMNDIVELLSMDAEYSSQSECIHQLGMDGTRSLPVIAKSGPQLIES